MLPAKQALVPYPSDVLDGQFNTGKPFTSPLVAESAADYRVLWRSRQRNLRVTLLERSDSLEFAPGGGLNLVASGPNPAIGPADAFPVIPGQRYRVMVDVTYNTLTGAIAPDVIAWSVDGRGQLVDADTFVAAFPTVEAKDGERLTFSAEFTMGEPAPPGPANREIAAPDAAAFVRFSSNPVRGADGSSATLHGIQVIPVQE